ncbi:hypothetical protein SERLA73DRAFT_55599 [Serpula lacrymans var. lacrymans S7.3]|uniref:Phosphoglycerate mutase-like protein n=1 Tax=Serpula lacrymans var. lacrymans (strain S7.3) TaxID=936435 RepID=F8Q1E7_SERL3|nr:hypothetical protein SERLA73DRAFT_55599 [Serpula lacrymans var. lacrymans S7.3]
MSLVQGLWPPSPNNTVSLANGTTITAPLGGYQYVPIESVDPNLDVSLEGFLDCNTFDDSTTAFYNSTEFQEKASESAAFLSLLPPYLDGRAVTLENMIFDFMNVESIHNAAFAKALPTTFLAQARALANWHEYNVFSSPQIGGIGNIAGQTMVLSILNGLSAIVDPTNPQKFVYEAVAYKPILSLFNMTGVAAANPELAGIVNYAGAVAFEVRQPSSGGEPVVRFNFKNGTDSDFVTYNYMNRTGDVPLSVFIDTLAPVGVNTTADWCNVCQNNQDRGCSALTLAYNQGHAAASTKISPVGAGFLGAGLTIAVIAILFGVLAFMGLLTLGRLSKRARKETDSDVSVAIQGYRLF